MNLPEDLRVRATFPADRVSNPMTALAANDLWLQICSGWLDLTGIAILEKGRSHKESSLFPAIRWLKSKNRVVAA
jgi:hypothetical protein